MATPENIIVNFSDVPKDFTPCFATECAQHAECIRYVVGQQIPLDGPCRGLSIYPQACRGAKPCPYFVQARSIVEAWGFDALFVDVLARDAHPLRMQIENYLGSHTTYFRYHRGERTLTPEQQADILAFFEQRGYDTSQLRFDNYRQTIDYHTD